MVGLVAQTLSQLITERKPTTTAMAVNYELPCVVMHRRLRSGRGGKMSLRDEKCVSLHVFVLYYYYYYYYYYFNLFQLFHFEHSFVLYKAWFLFYRFS